MGQYTKCLKIKWVSKCKTSKAYEVVHSDGYSNSNVRQWDMDSFKTRWEKDTEWNSLAEADERKDVDNLRKLVQEETSGPNP